MISLWLKGLFNNGISYVHCHWWWKSVSWIETNDTEDRLCSSCCCFYEKTNLKIKNPVTCRKPKKTVLWYINCLHFLTIRRLKKDRAELWQTWWWRLKLLQQSLQISWPFKKSTLKQRILPMSYITTGQHRVEFKGPGIELQLHYLFWPCKMMTRMSAP